MHLTDDLKEKQFKLLMSSNELFEGCPTKKDKNKILIDYGNWLSKELGRPLVVTDFEEVGRVGKSLIRKYFSCMANYFNSCDFPPAHRKTNMTDSEMREFLKSIKIETGSCWVTDYWKKTLPDGRIQIAYRGKNQYLSRVSYTLFKDSIPDGLVVMHKCDNPPCFNPKHLVVGTKKDNSRDAAKKGKIVSTSKKIKYHKITDPYDYESLLNFVKQYIEITEKDEWIFVGGGTSQKYPSIQINKKKYQLHRLILANKLGKKYDEIDGVACHRLPNDSRPNTYDVNPDHLFEGTRSENSLDAKKYSKKFKLNIDKAKRVKDAAAKSDFSKRGSKRRFDKKWAAKLDVSRQCITDIRLGRSWK